MSNNANPGLIAKEQYFDLPLRMISYSMTKAQQEIPNVGVNGEIDITDFWNEFQAVKKEVDYKLTFNTLFMKVVTECLKANPVLNSHVFYEPVSSSGRISYKDHIDVSLPTVFPNGKMFPLKVRNIENMNLREISAAMDDLMKRYENSPLVEVLYDLTFEQTMHALKQGKVITVLKRLISSSFGNNKIIRATKEERKKYKLDKKAGTVLTKDDIGEGTLSITNWGSTFKDVNLQCTYAPLIPPTCLCQSVAPVRNEQYVIEDENGNLKLAYKKILPFGIFFDHRIGGFGDIIPYIKKMDEIFKNPQIIREWL